MQDKTLIGSEEYSCCDGIATCARVTVVDENLAGKTVTLLFEFTGNINDNHTFRKSLYCGSSIVMEICHCYCTFCLFQCVCLLSFIT